MIEIDFGIPKPDMPGESGFRAPGPTVFKERKEHKET